ncbi:MAG: helix-turn-helix transcriptional regulator [Oscillospiraceae bacterium]|nr:helix-turn-helix transcriptional regulator [Oscillospiraceae bacterium]
MGRGSSREKKNTYQLAREARQLSREKAAEEMEWISPERIERIESEKSLPHPDEVLLMAEVYKDPSLCNDYCATKCPIGQQYVPHIKIKDLSQIVLEMLASLNAVQRQTERFIEITADGEISDDELMDFVKIQKGLEKISVTVETLQLWAEQMMANGRINLEQYNTLMGR